jgi:putative ABC transport system ATP-binding protein
MPDTPALQAVTSSGPERQAPSQQPAALQVSDLGKQVRLPTHALTILEGVSFRVEHGDTVAIVGASGSGKSTLLSLMAGLDIPSSGSVLLAGEPLSSLDEDGRARVRGEKVGFVFQSFQLLPSLTALENVMLPLELRGDADVEGPARAILTKVGLGERLDHYPRQLSGGEQQRVALARAFVTRPSVLFADEPTGNLDTGSSEEVLTLLRRAVDDFGQTVVMVTHDAQAAAHADRVVVLVDGRVVRDEPACSAEEVLDLMKQVA